jgi:hypothetical protein
MKATFAKPVVDLLLTFLAVAQSPCFGQTNLSVKLLHFDGPPAYREAVSKLMQAEANSYASALNLPETFPITTNSLTEIFISSPYVAERFGAMGSLRTTNFSYGFGKGKHLCYITRIIKGTNPFDYEANKPYAIDPSAVNTNAAYRLATQFLAKAFVDVGRLTTSSVVSVKPWVILHMTTSKYTLEWQRGSVMINGEPFPRPVAKVVLTSPQNELWTLRVEDPSLILRKPLEITNLDYLLSQTNAPAETNVPARQ